MSMIRRTSARCGVLLLAIALIVPGTLRAFEETSASLARMHVALVKKCERAVVGITAQATARKAGYFGTGTLISADGYILTSTTVVPGDSDVISVILLGGKRAVGKLVGTVDALELSVIKIDGSGHPFIPLGTSGGMKLGDAVYTFGNCFHSIEADDRVSLSRGSVSGFYELTEKKSGAEYAGPCIEISAALNPGVDGGPLVNERGEIVGLLSLNFSPVRWMGVAIAVDGLKPHMTTLMAGKKPDGKPTPAALPAPEQLNRAALSRTASGVVALTIERTKDIPAPAQKAPKQPAQPGPRGEESKEFWQRPEGPVTAFIISDDGWALTSWYNVAGELKKIDAHLPGGTTATAKVVGWDESKDIALIKIEAKGLPVPTWAKDNAYATGDTVYCLGKSPDPRRLTLEEGIVSATGRSMGDCIQLDAKLNYGNVGGPVVNRNGEVVGIACKVSNASRWGQSSGIGFAATWAKIRPILDGLKSGKKYKQTPQPFLGVQFDFEAHETDGALIKEVVAGAPAEKAGMKNGDVVIEANGAPINDPSDLQREIRKYKVGDKIKLKIQREGKELALTAELAARAEEQ